MRHIDVKHGIYFMRKLRAEGEYETKIKASEVTLFTVYRQSKRTVPKVTKVLFVSLPNSQRYFYSAPHLQIKYHNLYFCVHVWKQLLHVNNIKLF